MNRVLLKAFPTAAGQRFLLARPARPRPLSPSTTGGAGFSVVLHDDAVHKMSVVKKKLLAVIPDMCELEATEITARAHRTGQCIVRARVEETLAQKYCDGLRARALTCTVEPSL
jgi:ATP-dependent Clp protease adapter protein ClpS